ncbi:demethoxyubiquinone hydroxylase family protein [Sandarakinorhabdus oryzae]|uniref:demethoxyubiquinone hydroxylase family protein n=1 Tax=Sandarakinorhabdus oryzae TaxID=2675220 RepID=UPI0012E2E522|nr:demethoxyubiquinone hydroxylase family protein [Sandarakinorhabdus oryzae]
MADAETPLNVRRHLPGDRRADRQAMVRVDQAGEHGAARIYAGQLAVMGGRHKMAGEIRHMAHQEQRHLDGMNGLMARRGVRPTLLGPFWHVAGFALGTGTALLGPRAAMACTEAVETVIDEHYGEQTAALADGSDPELKAMIDDYRADEVEHRDAAAAHTGGGAFPVLEAVIRAGCRTAIAVAKRL